MATLTSYDFFVCGIVVLKTGTRSDRNDKNATILKLGNFSFMENIIFCAAYYQPFNLHVTIFDK